MPPAVRSAKSPERGESRKKSSKRRSTIAGWRARTTDLSTAKLRPYGNVVFVDVGTGRNELIRFGRRANGLWPPTDRGRGWIAPAAESAQQPSFRSFLRSFRTFAALCARFAFLSFLRSVAQTELIGVVGGVAVRGAPVTVS